MTLVSHLSGSFPSLHLLPLPLFSILSLSYPLLSTLVYSTALLFLISYLRHPVCPVAQSPAILQPIAKLVFVP
jgi:hypothetical protein